MGGVVTDTNCQRASQSLNETIAVSLFARLPPRALLAANRRSRVTRVRLLFPRGFSSKRETARSLVVLWSPSQPFFVSSRLLQFANKYLNILEWRFSYVYESPIDPCLYKADHRCLSLSRAMARLLQLFSALVS